MKKTVNPKKKRITIVQIKKAYLKSFWYSNHIGSIVSVVDHNRSQYAVTEPIAMNGFIPTSRPTIYSLDKRDVKVIGTILV